MAHLTPERERLGDRSQEELRNIWAGGESKVPRSRSSSASSGSISLEEASHIRTAGLSKGFLAGNFFDRDDVPCIPVFGTEIKNNSDSISFIPKQLNTYYVKRVLSPFEFYLERESETKPQESLRHKKMQEFYENEENRAYEYSIQVNKLKCYAYYDPLSKSWWRVRVLDYETEGGTNRAHIYYCDTGKQEYILCEFLRQLHEEFQGARDSVILKCYLYDVLPESGNLHWSMDAVVFFKELISGLRLGAVVMKLSRKPVLEYAPDTALDCGVILTEKVDPEERPDTINWIMVKMGYARSIGIMSGSSNVLNMPGFVPSFSIPENIVKRAAIEVQNKYGTPISLEELRIITARAMANPGPDLAPPVYCERPMPMKSLSNPEKYLPYNIRCRLAWMRMSSVEGPDKIFIHMNNKKLELKALEAEMETACLQLPRPSLESLKPGSLVTCYMKDLNQPSQNAWSRSVVMKVDLSIEAVKVLMVDYGNIMKVNISVIYELPDKYRAIPSFVHRVHLNDIRPGNISDWDAAINSLFYKYVISHEVDEPLYYIHVANKTDIIKFTDVGQGLFFNDIENKWIANYPKMSDENDAINAMKNDPLVASYFCSHPVSIFYEVAVEPDKFWNFANLSNYLVKRKYAKLVSCSPDKDKIHEILQNGFGTL